MSRSHRFRARVAMTGLAAAAVLAGCATYTWSPKGPTAQGWDQAAREAWYNADQGSRFMPLKWFQALERPNDSGAAPGPFLDADYLAKFRILPPLPGAPYGLPVGFAVDRIDDSRLVETRIHWTADKTAPVDWVGLNCAACHTGRLTYQGRTITVDGAPSQFDFQSFVEAADKALAETRASANPGADAGRWNRFAAAVLGAKDDNAEGRARLLAGLDRLIDWEARTEALNHTGLRYGFGRVDAVGHIFNRILLFGGAPQPTPNAATAPVSYPHLWNIGKQTHLQWDGIATNGRVNIGLTPTDFGALGRNTGEVLGVFGEAVISPPSGLFHLSGFKSSANVRNLNRMEVLVTHLEPPTWPTAFGIPGDIGLTDGHGRGLSPTKVVDAGRTLFVDHCSSCHTPHKTYETMKTFADVGAANVTDEWMACNTWAYEGASGKLTGIPENYISGPRIPPVEPVRVLLTSTVKGALIGRKVDLVLAAGENIFDVTPLPAVTGPKGATIHPQTPDELRLKRCRANAGDALMAYKARPLEGIWATAPYLHNGSVPTLYDLLRAPSDRPPAFGLGTREFDPVKVGYSTDPASPGNAFSFDTTLAGNSNKGHDYGVSGFTEPQRLELLEYLKTL